MNDADIVIWKSQPVASKEWNELMKCTCKANCGLKCHCKKAELPCTELCVGGGGCF